MKTIGAQSGTNAGARATPDAIALVHRLEALRDACVEMEREHAPALDDLRGPALASARNLVHYLAIRKHDLRDLQRPLGELGLSSLGRNESHVLANLDAVIVALRALAGASDGATRSLDALTAAQGGDLLASRARALLGPAQTGRPVRIMVTLPTEAADDPTLVGALLASGVSCVRINTAHDTPAHWERMCLVTRAAAERLGVECRILMDLAGPKLRTGPFEAGPEVARIRPKRDMSGRVVEPGRALLRPASAPALLTPEGPELPAPDAFVGLAEAGDEIVFRDARKRRRVFTVVRRRVDGRVVLAGDRTAYITSGTRLRLRRDGADIASAEMGRLPATAQSARVRVGETLRLSLTGQLGRPAAAGVNPAPAVVTATLPEAFRAVRVGERVWFDDGKVGAVVRRIDPDGLDLEVTTAAVGGSRIAADKGVNLPDSSVEVAGLTPDDIDALPLVARHADLVGMSFIQTPEDVLDLRARLDALGAGHVGLVLKIETKRAFENLPSLLLAALRSPVAGVMIARGDLGVECGFERLAEVQEEILWLCEAAHLPVIWATQVLESLAKTGRVSRAEVTDAAMSERAECVMLNKGPYIIEAVRFLDTVLRRMHEHFEKKRPMLRALNVARRFGASVQP